MKQKVTLHQQTSQMLQATSYTLEMSTGGNSLRAHDLSNPSPTMSMNPNLGTKKFFPYPSPRGDYPSLEIPHPGFLLSSICCLLPYKYIKYITI